MSTGKTMKTFKKFVQDKNKEEVPSLIIYQGKHSRKKDKEEVPSKLILQGKHSKPSIKEDVDKTHKNFQHFREMDDQANKHIGDASETQDEMHTRHPFHSLSQGEKDAVGKYTNDSFHLNTALYKNKPLAQHHANHVEMLDRATKKFKLKEKLHVFSGVKFDPHYEASKNSERKIHLPAYTSTSIKPSVARGFSDGKPHPSKTVYHMMRFNLPKGHHGLYIGTHSNHTDEHEFLLPRNTSWNISKNPEVHPHPYDRHGEVHIWDAHPADEHHDDRQMKFDFKK